MRLPALYDEDGPDGRLVRVLLDRIARRGVAHQISVFEQVTRDLPGERSLSNSAAILRHRVRSDWVRAGILCYGSAPDFPQHDSAHWGLQPAMTLRSRLIATQQLQPGDRVGYGGTFTAPHAMRIGVVACGYADGYPRHAPDGTPVLVDGVRVPMAGRVSMDMITVDLSAVPHAHIGSEVTLWGNGPVHDGQATLLPIDEVAHHCGTIGYELMCALSSRVPVQVLSPHQNGT